MRTAARVTSRKPAARKTLPADDQREYDPQDRACAFLETKGLVSGQKEAVRGEPLFPGRGQLQRRYIHGGLDQQLFVDQPRFGVGFMVADQEQHVGAELGAAKTLVDAELKFGEIRSLLTTAADQLDSELHGTFQDEDRHCQSNQVVQPGKVEQRKRRTWNSSLISGTNPL